LLKLSPAASGRSLDAIEADLNEQRNG